MNKAFFICNMNKAYSNAGKYYFETCLFMNKDYSFARRLLHLTWQRHNPSKRNPILFLMVVTTLNSLFQIGSAENWVSGWSA